MREMLPRNAGAFLAHDFVVRHSRSVRPSSYFAFRRRFAALAESVRESIVKIVKKTNLESGLRAVRARAANTTWPLR